MFAETDVCCVIAAHPDDEVLGCGGTIARLAEAGCAVHILLLADGESARDVEPAVNITELVKTRSKKAEQACAVLGCASTKTTRLPDNRLDSVELLEIVKLVEKFVDQYHPTIVITHHRGDVNIDHRIVHDAVLAACRPEPNHCTKELLFFEVSSSTEWQTPDAEESFHPNYFVDITSTVQKKLKALEVYESEMREVPHPRSLKAVEALSQWRGATAGVEAAEAFVLGRKLI
jgi:LmbE family N-acetylglucosaminyl deacetylase